MIYCSSCGTSNLDDAEFCASCGARIIPLETPAHVQSPVTPVYQVPSKSRDNTKVLCVLSYLIYFLWIGGLVNQSNPNNPRNPVLRHHTGQGIILTIYFFAFIPISSIFQLFGVVVLVLVYITLVIFGIVCLIKGIVNATKLNMKKLPLIGRFAFYK